MSLRRRVRGILLAPLLCAPAAIPSTARAFYNEILCAVVLVPSYGVDIGFGIHDLVMLGQGKHPTMGAAVAEVVLAVPQIVLTLSMGVSEPRCLAGGIVASV